MCLNPKKLLKKGKYKQDNYRGFEGDFYELNTFSKCGHCSQCNAERASAWVVRNYFEEKAHKKKCFITLTYAENPYIIVRKDMQDFLKRLRIYLDRQENHKKIRIFYAMEFGLISQRPHGHIIIYGWNDPNAQYLGINKKRNIILQSNIIQKIWGLGRTSYQDFTDTNGVAPYIALYETNKGTAKRNYILTREKAKKLLELYRRNNIDPKRRKVLSENLKELQKEMDKEKLNYMCLREINGWSKSLGWEEFYKDYCKSNIYVFEVPIMGTTHPIPTPWIKKLANPPYGSADAAAEMFRRQDEMEKVYTENEAKIKAELKEGAKKKREIMNWIDKKDKIELDI